MDIAEARDALELISAIRRSSTHRLCSTNQSEQNAGISGEADGRFAHVLRLEAFRGLDHDLFGCGGHPYLISVIVAPGSEPRMSLSLGLAEAPSTMAFLSSVTPLLRKVLFRIRHQFVDGVRHIGKIAWLLSPCHDGPHNGKSSPAGQIRRICADHRLIQPVVINVARRHELPRDRHCI